MTRETPAGSPGGVLAVVPARGGSVGLPGKNGRLLCGRPLLAWSVQAALDAELVDRVICSTDDPVLADLARDAGAEVPGLRPAALAGGEVPDLPVMVHVLDVLRDTEGWVPDVVVHLRPTSPVRPAGLVDAAVTALLEHPEVDAVRSVSPADKTPYKMWRRGDDGLLEPLLGSWDEALFDRPRQALPEVLVHDGVIDVVRVATLRSGSMTGRRLLGFVTPPGVAVDIDDLAGLEQAARLLADHLAASPEVDAGSAGPAMP